MKTKNKPKKIAAIISGLLSYGSIGMVVIMAIMMWAFNEFCAGQSCDGSTADTCSPDNNPGFFLVLTVFGIMACISLVTFIINVVKIERDKRKEKEDNQREQ